MIDYFSFLPQKTAEVAEKLDKVEQKREKLHKIYLGKPVTSKSLKNYVEEDWRLHNLQAQCHNELIPLLRIKVVSLPLQ